MSDAYRFLDPWTMILPEGDGAVVAAVGSGGKTVLLTRLLEHYRSAGATVLWTQTVDHPAPPAADLSDGSTAGVAGGPIASVADVG